MYSTKHFHDTYFNSRLVWFIHQIIFNFEIVWNKIQTVSDIKIHKNIVLIISAEIQQVFADSYTVSYLIRDNHNYYGLPVTPVSNWMKPKYSAIALQIKYTLH